MEGDMLRGDRAMQDLRHDIDAIDAVRSEYMAAWIVSTVVQLDRLSSGEMDRAEVQAHWRPLNHIELISRRRDRRTVQVGQRKKELEEKHGQCIAINQEGRWQSVKHTYQHAAAEACARNELSQDDSYTVLEWMHHYTENEHLRSKQIQEPMSQCEDGSPSSTPYVVGTLKPVESKIGLKFPHLPLHGRPARESRDIK